MQDCLLAPSASGGLMDIPQVHASAKACGQGTWVGNMVAPTFIPADPSAPRAPHVPPAPWSCSPDSFALPATSSSSSCCCCCCCCFYFCCVFCCCCKVILVMVRVCFLSGWISEVVCWVTPLWPAEGSTARQAWIRSRDVQRCLGMVTFLGTWRHWWTWKVLSSTEFYRPELDDWQQLGASPQSTVLLWHLEE